MVYKVYNSDNNFYKPLPVEKVVSVLAYLTAGFAGFVYLIIAVIAKKSLRPFLKYHVYQSIFVFMLLALFNYVINIVMPLITLIPIINKIFLFFYDLIFSNSFLFGFTIFNFFIFVMIIYLVIGVVLNKYSYIPYISKIIKYHVGGGM